MPLVRIELFERRLTPELESKLIERMTETLLEVLDAPELKEHTWVIVEGHDAHRWGRRAKTWAEERTEAVCGRIESYREYRGLEGPLRTLGRVLAELGVTGKIGADQDGYPGILGYEGPPLSEVTASTVAPLGIVIESMLARKSETEIALIRESARWCAHAHRLLQEY